MAITSSPTLMMGNPTIASTRNTVESILERLGAGESEAQIFGVNPRRTRQPEEPTWP